MTPLQALIDARALLADPEHWTQGAYAHTKTGNVIGPSTRGAVCWCSIGAVMRAVGYRTDETGASSALAALAQTIGTPLIGLWNDAPGRTHAEVLAAFNAAIARLEAQA